MDYVSSDTARTCGLKNISIPLFILLKDACQATTMHARTGLVERVRRLKYFSRRYKNGKEESSKEENNKEGESQEEKIGL